MPDISQQLLQARQARSALNSSRKNLMVDALELEQSIMGKSRLETTTALDLASLVRSFVALMDCIRILRGKPLPGQLQPSMDPAAMARRLKKIRRSKAIDISPEAIIEASESKESLKSAGG